MGPTAASTETLTKPPIRPRFWASIACATALAACTAHDASLRLSEPSESETRVAADSDGTESSLAAPLASTAPRPGVEELPFAERELLPDPFPISSEGYVVVNHPGLAQQGELPTNNEYDDAPGCYVACYSHSDDGIVYRVSQDIGVKGQFRTEGHYVGRVCQPEGWLDRDISKAGDVFAQLCDELVPTCHGDCWAGGDTGGWFGIQGGR